MKPVLLIFFIVIVATAPTTLGQSIYKCPGPDGLSHYQQTPCLQGAPMTIQDNGKESGDQDAVSASTPTPPTPPPAESSGSSEVATIPGQGQSIYKCPGPDGLSHYQQTPCPQGVPMTIQDNGKESGDQPRGLRGEECELLRSYGGRASALCINTAQENLPAETSGLRAGEREWLQAIRQREAGKVRRNYKQALRAEQPTVSQTQQSPAETSGLRAGEREWLQAIRQREAEAARRNYEQALRAEQPTVSQTQQSPTESNGRRAGEESAVVREIRQHETESTQRLYEAKQKEFAEQHPNWRQDYSHRDTQQQWRQDYSHRDTQQQWRQDYSHRDTQQQWRMGR